MFSFAARDASLPVGQSDFSSVPILLPCLS